MLATLESGGLVEREPGGPYRLGLHLVALADSVLARLDVLGVARPRPRTMVAQTGKIATLRSPAATRPSSSTSQRRVEHRQHGPDRPPSISHATAVGKMLLTYADGDPGVLDTYRERTITSAEALAAELTTVRERGWAAARASASPTSTRWPRRVFRRGGEPPR